MFTHNIDPTLINLGPLEIRYYGLVYFIGFIFILYYLNKYNKLNLKKETIENLVFYLMIGTILGARFFEVFVWHPSYYLANPQEILKIWKGGLAFHGALLGITITTYWFAKKHNIKFLKLADLLAIPAVFFLALGRIANFINAELVGTVTNVSWCVNFGDNLCRHPVQIYGAIKRFTVGIILIILSQKERKDGFIFFMMLTLLGAGRFILDFMREDPRLLGLSTGQYLSAIMVIVGIYYLFKSRNKFNN